MNSDLGHDDKIPERTAYRVLIRPYGSSFDCFADETLLTASRLAGLPLSSHCQQGACGHCKIRIRKGRVRLAPFMLSALSMEEIEADYTLACRSYPKTDLEIVTELVGRPQPRHYGRPGPDGRVSPDRSSPE